MLKNSLKIRLTVLYTYVNVHYQTITVGKRWKQIQFSTASTNENPRLKMSESGNHYKPLALFFGMVLTAITRIMFQ